MFGSAGDEATTRYRSAHRFSPFSQLDSKRGEEESLIYGVYIQLTLDFDFLDTQTLKIRLSERINR